jgi:hypothetical protein
MATIDHAENFIDLDDLDLAGIELTSWEVVAGGTLTAGCGSCSGNSGGTTTSSICGGGGSNY